MDDCANSCASTDISTGEFRLTECDRNGLPAEIAARWEREGASRLHLVDLDGAKAGRPVNVDAIRAIKLYVTAVADACLLGKIESGDSVAMAKNEFVEEDIASVEVVADVTATEAGMESSRLAE